MTDRRPLRLSSAAAWPLIARADRHDGKVECQANHVWAIRVREHADGRRVVYGWLRAGNGGVYAGWRGAEGGYLLEAIDHAPDEAGTVEAIRVIGELLDDPGLADECIGDLPPEDIDDAAPAQASDDCAQVHL
jgi:hypothetical protein